MAQSDGLRFHFSNDFIVDCSLQNNPIVDDLDGVQ